MNCKRILHNSHDTCNAIVGLIKKNKLTRYSTTRSIYPLSRGKTGLGKGGPGGGLFINGVLEVGTEGGPDLLGVELLGFLAESCMKDDVP